MSLTKTISDEAALGLKKAAVSLTVPEINLTVFRKDQNQLPSSIKKALLEIVGEYIDKELSS